MEDITDSPKALDPQATSATDLREKFIAALALTPAEGESEVTDAAIDAALAAIPTTAARAAESEAAAGTAADQLAAATAELTQVRADYQAIYDREEAARKMQVEAEVATILEQFADRITTPEAQARIQTILMSDRDAGMDILNGLPAAAAASAPKADTPPEPQYPVSSTTFWTAVYEFLGHELAANFPPYVGSAHGAAWHAIYPHASVYLEYDSVFAHDPDPLQRLAIARFLDTPYRK